MKSTSRRILSIALSLLMVVGVIAVGGGNIIAHAVCCRKDYFDKSKYTLTGNMAHDVATIAKSQKGRTCDQFGYSGVDYGAWCDEFVADCIENAGGDNSIVAHGGTVADFESQMRARGAVTVTSPKEGDLIFFTISHVEIVTKVENGVVYSAGGNNGNYPGSCAGERSTSWGTARCYLRPNYPSKPADSTPPSLSNLRYSEQKINGFRVECNFSDNVGVTRVAFPTWTTANGQDDLIWHEGTISNGKASVWINRSEHNNEFGTYVTDAYVYDAAGNYVSDRISTNAVNDTTGPKISHIKVTNVTSTGYTISCTIQDASPSSGINSVLFPTWTSSNGQDDIANPWPSGSLSGNTATYKVKYSEHNNETGMYNTHIYAYDNYGNYTPYNGVQVYPTRIGNMTEGKYVFQSALDSNKVIDIADPITGDASNVQLWDYTGDSSQIFEITKNGVGYTISPICSEYNIDAWGAKAANDVNIAQTNVNNDINQTWQFDSKGNGYYSVTSVMGSDGNDYVLDVAWKETANGTNIQLCKANGGNNQQFKLLPVYTVSYNANGGSGKPASQYKVSSKTLKLSSTKPTRIGYTFLGWSTSSSATTATYSAGGNYTANSGATLYAVWEETPVTPTTYTLNYNANGGNGAPASQTGNGNITLSNTKPTRSGYNFLGWAKSSTATAAQYQPGESFSLTGNTTLYAVWEETPVTPTTYTLTYNANGGSGRPASQTGNGNITLSSTKPTRSGYTFLGWAKSSTATAAQYQPGESFSLTGNTTLYAVWEETPVTPTTYTLTYNANGGSGRPANQTGNGTIKLSGTRPTRDGYTFKKWNTKSDGSGTSYNPGATYNLTANVTLYAIWQKNETPDNPDNPSIVQPTIQIKNYVPTKSVSWRATLKLDAVVENASDGAEVHWFYNGEDSLTGTPCFATNCKNTFTIQAKLISADGEILAESEIETVTATGGFFAKLIAFFKGLFGLLPIIEQ